MSVSLGQILIIILVGLLLFGNFPNIVRDLTRSFKSLIATSNEKSNEQSKTNLREKQEKRDSNP